MSPDDREHLENVYAKLGVHTRTAAAALVGEEMRRWDRRFEKIETRYRDFAGVESVEVV